MTSHAADGAVTFATVDDDWQVHWSVRLLAAAHPARVRLVAEAQSVEQLMALDTPPDVVLLDVYLGNDDQLSIASVRDLVAWPTKVLLHTKERTPAYLVRGIDLGASGLVLKPDGPERLIDTIVAAAAGEMAVSSPLAHALLNDSRCARLTDRQVEVLELIADGLSRKEAATELFLTEEGVKKHLADISEKYRTLGRQSGGKATVREATRDGYLRPRGS